MERLDFYDENMNYLGNEERDIVHKKGLWHKTIHCWLYDSKGNVYFQIRSDSQKLYTTASGHILAGETVKEAFHREVLEEIGVPVDISHSELIEINVWRMEKIKNGEPFIDKAFANVYMNLIDPNFQAYSFDTNEVLGVVKINAQACLDLFNQKLSSITAIKITQETSCDVDLTIDDFLVMKNEIAIIKYGKILQSIISKTKI